MTAPDHAAEEARLERIQDSPDLRWVETEGWEGRTSVAALLLKDDGARTVTVRLLADLKVGGRTFSAGTKKRVPRRAVVTFPSAGSHVVACDYNAGGPS